MAVIPPWAVALGCLILTLGLSWLTARVTAGLASVPIHFGITLEPNRFGSRWVAVLLIPGLQAALAVGLMVLPGLHLLRHGANGPMARQAIAGLGFAFAQGLFLVLLRRWRRRQG